MGASAWGAGGGPWLAVSQPFGLEASNLVRPYSQGEVQQGPAPMRTKPSCRYSVRVATPAEGMWLTARTGHVPGGDFRALVATRGDGAIAGMVGFDRWTPNSVHLHIALEAPAAGRCLLRPAFAEAFSGGRCLAVGMVRGSNERSVALARHLGFRETHRLRDGWAAGEDVVLFEMRRSECRWL